MFTCSVNENSCLAKLAKCGHMTRLMSAARNVPNFQNQTHKVDRRCALRRRIYTALQCEGKHVAQFSLCSLRLLKTLLLFHHYILTSATSFLKNNLEFQIKFSVFFFFFVASPLTFACAKPLQIITLEARWSREAATPCHWIWLIVH